MSSVLSEYVWREDGFYSWKSESSVRKEASKHILLIFVLKNGKTTCGLIG
ncbi:MAG: hypothetical protein QXO76_02025 [Thermoproteota archaeon]